MTLPAEWKSWINHNLDRSIAVEELRQIVISEGFSAEAVNEYFTHATYSHKLYTDLIKNIRADFNNSQQRELNRQNLKNFIEEQKKHTALETISSRLKDQWLALDPKSRNLEIRARKIAFFAALDNLILGCAFDFPYPNPLEFNFFPTQQNLPDADLHFLKNDEGKPLKIGTGGFCKIYQGVFRGEQVAVKHLALSEFNFAERWKWIVAYYRQSLVTFEQSFDGVLPMKEIFFYEEKSLFEDGANHSILIIYPLCRNNFLNLAEEKIFFQNYQSFLPFKHLLETLNQLHQNNICINDLKDANILFDFSGRAFFHDLDFWLPKNVTEVESTHLFKKGLLAACFGLNEMDFLLSEDLSLILPDKLDIWCFAVVILTGFGYSDKIGKVEWKKLETTNLVQKNSQKLAELKEEIKNFTNSVFADFSQKIAEETDLKQKKFLTDVKEFLTSCLTFDPQNRPSAAELLNYNLFTFHP